MNTATDHLSQARDAIRAAQSSVADAMKHNAAGARMQALADAWKAAPDQDAFSHALIAELALSRR